MDPGRVKVVVAFALGAGAGIVGALALASDGRRSGPVEERAPTSREDAKTPAPTLAAAPSSEPACEAPPRRTLSTRSARSTSIVPFDAGTAVLGIGDAFRFGERFALEPAKAADADVTCADIEAGESVTLRCPHGAARADVPLGAIGVPERGDAAAILVVDAPTDLPQGFASLAVRAPANVPGVALVRAASGATYKVWLVEVLPDAEALERLAKIGYAEVPSVAGGGVIRVPTTTPDGGGPSSATENEIERIVATAKDIPGDGFASFVRGRYERPSALPDALGLDRKAHLVVREPLATTLSFVEGGGLFAEGGIGTSGRVEYGGYTGVLVRGDMGGAVVGRSYGYVHVTGDMRGTVEAKSYTTVVVDGDLTGTLFVRSYATILVRGRLTGTIDPSGACWSTLYLDGFRSRAEIEAMTGDFRQFTLHVRSSEMPVGKQPERIGSFRDVIVGDDVWKRLARPR